MAIIKVVKRSGKTAYSLKAVLEYVGKKADFSFGINCSDNHKQVFTQFMETKKFFEKEKGRQYRHYIQSFALGEIEKDKVLSLGIQWAEKVFKGYEVFIVTHTDKEHLHNHIVINSVNYIDGKKFQERKNEFKEKMLINDEVCLENGINNVVKTREIGEITTPDRKKYEIIKKGADITRLAETVLEVCNSAQSKDNFISQMREKGYSVDWQDNKKHVVFTVGEDILQGKKDKFRLSNLNKTFNIPLFEKENLLEKFKENSKERDLSAFDILDRIKEKSKSHSYEKEFYHSNTNGFER